MQQTSLQMVTMLTIKRLGSLLPLTLSFPPRRPSTPDVLPLAEAWWPGLARLPSTWRYEGLVAGKKLRPLLQAGAVNDGGQALCWSFVELRIVYMGQ